MSLLMLVSFYSMHRLPVLLYVRSALQMVEHLREHAPDTVSVLDEGFGFARRLLATQEVTPRVCVRMCVCLAFSCSRCSSLQ